MEAQHQDSVAQLIDRIERQSWTIPGRTHLFYTNPSYTAVLWDVNRGNSIAESPYVTIDETPGGKWLADNLRSLGVDRELQGALWEKASECFARSASGPVVALVFGDNDRNYFRWPTRNEGSISQDPESVKSWQSRQVESGPLVEDTRSAFQTYAPHSSVWQTVELPSLLNNPNVTSINGLPRGDLVEFKQSSANSEIALARISRDVGEALLYPQTSPVPPSNFNSSPVTQASPPSTWGASAPMASVGSSSGQLIDHNQTSRAGWGSPSDTNQSSASGWWGSSGGSQQSSQSSWGSSNGSSQASESSGWGSSSGNQPAQSGWGTTGDKSAAPQASAWGASASNQASQSGWGWSSEKSTSSQSSWWGSSSSNQGAQSGWGSSGEKTPVPQSSWWGSSGSGQGSQSGWGNSAEKSPASQSRWWGSSGGTQGGQSGWGCSGDKSQTSPANSGASTVKTDASWHSSALITTRDYQVTKDICAVYNAVPGGVPGGMLLSTVGIFPFQLQSVEVADPFFGKLLINGQYEFDTGLTSEELGIITESVYSGKGEKNFGATNYRDIVGTEKGNVVGLLFTRAELRFGELVWGATTDGRLARDPAPGYRNPEVLRSEGLAEMKRDAYHSTVASMQSGLHPSVFLEVPSCSFKVEGGTKLSVVPTLEFHKVLYSYQSGSKGPFTGSEEEHEAAWQECYPHSLQSTKHFCDNLRYYLTTEKIFQRYLSYGVVLALLRELKKNDGSLVEHGYLERAYKQRIVSDPEFRHFHPVDSEAMLLRSRAVAQSGKRMRSGDFPRDISGRPELELVVGYYLEACSVGQIENVSAVLEPLGFAFSRRAELDPRLLSTASKIYFGGFAPESCLIQDLLHKAERSDCDAPGVRSLRDLLEEHLASAINEGLGWSHSCQRFAKLLLRQGEYERASLYFLTSVQMLHASQNAPIWDGESKALVCSVENFTDAKSALGWIRGELKRSDSPAYASWLWALGSYFNAPEDKLVSSTTSMGPNGFLPRNTDEVGSPRRRQHPTWAILGELDAVLGDFFSGGYSESQILRDLERAIPQLMSPIHRGVTWDEVFSFIVDRVKAVSAKHAQGE